MAAVASGPAAPFAPAAFTRAPLRIEGSAELSVPQEKAFALVSEGLHQWLPMLKSARFDHAASSSAGHCGVGSERHCTFGGGMGDVEERIVWWDAPRGYAFTFAPRNKVMMPTRDHLNLFAVEARGTVASRFTWRSYFDWEGILMRHVSRLMMPGMLNDALKSLVKQTGGEAGTFRWVAHTGEG